MHLTLLSAMLLAAVAGRAQAPAGRWDGTIKFDSLKVPFRIDFEGAGDSIKGSLVNGDARVPSTSGSFADGKLHLFFDRSEATLDATLAEGELKGTIKGAAYGTRAFTASAFCSCGFEGEAGPDISGTWEVPTAGWRLEILRKGEDTFVILKGSRREIRVVRPLGAGVDQKAIEELSPEEIGPLTGRFDGLTFSLCYFDGRRAALLEMEPRSGGLDLIWTEPGQDARKFRAISAKAKQ